MIIIAIINIIIIIIIIIITIIDLLVVLYFFYRILLYTVGQDSSVGIPTRYGLDGPGIESR